MGLIYLPDGSLPWARSHAMLPTPLDLGDGRLRIYSFSIGLGLRALLRFTAVCLISYYLGLQVLIFCVEVLHIHEALAPLIVAAVMLPFTFVGSRAALTGQLTKR